MPKALSEITFLVRNLLAGAMMFPGTPASLAAFIFLLTPSTKLLAYSVFTFLAHSLFPVLTSVTPISLVATL